MLSELYSQLHWIALVGCKFQLRLGWIGHLVRGGFLQRTKQHNAVVSSRAHAPWSTLLLGAFIGVLDGVLIEGLLGFM